MIVGEAEVIIKANTAALEEEVAAAGDSSLGGLQTKADKAGEDAGQALSGGFGGGAAHIGEKTEKDLEESTGRMKGVVSNFGEKATGLLSNLGVPESLLSGAALSSIAIAAVAAGAVDLGVKMQDADTKIATSEGITVKAATNIGDAMLNTAGKTKFSAEEQAGAFATVAGQLKSVEGHALTVKQSMQVMNAASDLATAKGIDLATATQTIAASMQAFQMKTKDSAQAADILFNASNATGEGIDTVGAALDRVRSKMGAAAPPMGQLAGLLVDMTNHGETGRAAMTALASVFTTLEKPVTAAAKAHNALKEATDSLTPSMRSLAHEYLSGAMTSKEASDAAKSMSTEQAALWKNFTSSALAAQKANDAQKQFGVTLTNSKGQMLPMGQIIAQLSEKIKGMTTAQATAELGTLGFSSSAAQLVSVIKAGPAAYDEATSSVTKMNSAHNAAETQSKTLADQFDTLKSTVIDFGTQLGQMLIPIVEQLMSVLNILIPIIGTVLKAAFAVLKPVIEVIVDEMKITVNALKDLINFVTDIFEGKWSDAWKMVGHLFSDAWDEIKTLAFQIPGEIFSKLPGLILEALGDLNNLLYNAGRDIIKGLIKGIKDMGHEAIDAAKDVGKGILHGIKDLFSIFSPSQVMADIGGNITKGLALGITNEKTTAVNAALDLANAVTLAGTPNQFGVPNVGHAAAHARGSKTGATSGASGAHTYSFVVQSGAVVIHPAAGNDTASLNATERAIEDAFNRLSVELSAGISSSRLKV